ncbi:nucleotidyltransferase domain-containing protein [bacterium]|nr:nucleotidyltransferase domain-containing protein [bacterium]
MLELLFTSKARVKILTLLLLNSDNSYYQREISKLTSVPIRGVQRELDKLVKIGLVDKSKNGNRLYFRANRTFPIFEELKKIIIKSTGIANALTNRLKKAHDIYLAFIYGSYAKGEENINSDIDLFVVGDLNLKELSGILSKEKENLNREINYTVMSSQEFAERIKQNEHFLSALLKDDKIFIIGDENDIREISKSG